jgi:hypothetical protein
VVGNVLFAVILGATAIAATLLAAPLPLAVRRPVRFSTALLTAPAFVYGVMAFAPSFEAVAPAVVLLVAALAPTILALAVLRAIYCAPSPLVTMGLLIGVALAGLLAAVTGFVLLVLLTLAGACVAMAGAMVRRARGRDLLQGAVGVLAFPAGVFAFLHDAGDGRFLLFFACGLLGLALTLARVSHPAVEVVRDLRHGGAIAR